MGILAPSNGNVINIQQYEKICIFSNFFNYYCNWWW